MKAIKIRNFLKNKHVHFETIIHPKTYTAQRTAEVTHIKGKQFAKAVVLKGDGQLLMAVLPAGYHVDLRRMKQITGCRAMDLASQRELEGACPGTTIGAIPPFGNLYHFPVFIDAEIAQKEKIAFNAGSHEMVIKMGFGDYQRIVHPRIADIHRH